MSDTAPHILALVGMAGSGKSVAADFFRSKGHPVLRFGDQTDLGLKEHNLPRNEKNERWYREKLRNELGMAAMAKKIEPRVREAAKEHDFIVLDGLYSWEEYLYLSRVFLRFTLLCIHAAPALRYERLKNRPIRPLTIGEARSRDAAEIEHLNKGGPIAMADLLLLNESSKEDFHQKLENLYRLL